MRQPHPDEESHRSSQGHVLSDASWLDVHLEAARASYATLLDAAGFTRGDRLLDAGCGSGAYLRLLREHVGQTSAIYALDVAEENVRSAAGLGLAFAVRGSLLRLPFGTGVFDA